MIRDKIKKIIKNKQFSTADKLTEKTDELIEKGNMTNLLKSYKEYLIECRKNQISYADIMTENEYILAITYNLEKELKKAKKTFIVPSIKNLLEGLILSIIQEVIMYIPVGFISCIIYACSTESINFFLPTAKIFLLSYPLLTIFNSISYSFKEDKKDLNNRIEKLDNLIQENITSKQVAHDRFIQEINAYINNISTLKYEGYEEDLKTLTTIYKKYIDEKKITCHLYITNRL